LHFFCVGFFLVSSFVVRVDLDDGLLSRTTAFHVKLFFLLQIKGGNYTGLLGRTIKFLRRWLGFLLALRLSLSLSLKIFIFLLGLDLRLCLAIRVKFRSAFLRFLNAFCLAPALVFEEVVAALIIFLRPIWFQRVQAMSASLQPTSAIDSREGSWSLCVMSIRGYE
jgi:hypothetical protein